MRVRLAVILGVSVCVPAAGTQQHADSTSRSDAAAAAAASGPGQAVRESMYALHANNAAGFQKRILPQAGSTALIGRQTFTPEQLDNLKREIEALRLRQTSAPSRDGDPLATGRRLERAVPAAGPVGRRYGRVTNPCVPLASL